MHQPHVSTSAGQLERRILQLSPYCVMNRYVMLPRYNNSKSFNVAIDNALFIAKKPLF